MDEKDKNDMFKPSNLGQRISKTGNILNNSANLQIEEYHKQVQQNSILYKKLVKNLIIDSFDTSDAFTTSQEFFRKESISFVAIDGTEYAKQFFDMVIFYAGAYSCEGALDFNYENGAIKPKYQEKFLEKGSEISSCVPVYINKIPEIDTKFHDSQNQPNSFLSQLSEEWILDNTEISKSLMTFSEFYLAYTIAASKQADIIFMDRSLSNMYSSLFASTSRKDDWNDTCSLLNYVVDDIPLDINDLSLAQHNVCNELLSIPPSRGDYLRYSIFFKVLENEPIDFASLCRLMDIDIDDYNEKRIERAKKYAERWVEEGVIVKENNGQYKIGERYRSTWTRVRKLVNTIGDQIFKSEKDPFLIIKNINGQEKKEWITTTDLAFLTLFALYMLVEECWKNNILLVGITKDTIARDFSNHLLPIGIENALWTINPTDDEDKDPSNDTGDTVYSDRMLLQTISLLNHESLRVPWSIIEYDSAFVMAIPDRRKRKGYVSGAIKNKITTNKLFLRSFVQLEQAETENRLRSNVLFIDRLVYPQFDFNTNVDNTVKLIHEYGNEELVDFLLYKDNSTKNPVQNLIMSILRSMTSPSIPECFGHNKALYIADKVAKWHNEEFRKIVDSTIFLISNKKNLRNFLFYMNTFREKRHDFESNR